MNDIFNGWGEPSSQAELPIGTGERHLRDPGHIATTPNARTDKNGSARRPPSNANSFGGHPSADDRFVQGDRSGGVYRGQGDVSQLYDTLRGPQDVPEVYNQFIFLFARAVAATEGIMSLMQRLTAEQSALPEPGLGSDKVLKVREAARLLGLNEQTVRRYCRERVFGRQIKSGHWVIGKSEIDNFLQGRARTCGKKKGVS
jgi:predicted DNA-binding transcriptional regulator AlpA